MDIEASARKHGVHDDDMLHAYRHHLAAFATNDESVTMFVGPSRTGQALEVGVVVDDQRGHHPRHASSSKVSERMVDAMTKRSRADKAAALERWADKVKPGDLVVVDTSALQQLAKLAEQREALDDEVTDAVHAARRANRSWSEIGAMLGVSKQAAQRKYGQHAASA